MFFALLLLFVLLFPNASYSVSPEEEYKKIQEQMLEQKKKINEAKKREYSVLSDIENVNMKLGKIEAELGKFRKKLRQNELEIAAVNAEISKTKTELDKHKDWIKRKLRIMHKIGYSGDIVMLLLSVDDISQMMRIWKYLENITRHEHRVLTDYRGNLRNLEEKTGQLLLLKAELRKNEEEIKRKENELAGEKRAREVILSSVRHEKAMHQKMLSELKEASKKLLELIRESAKTDTYSGTGFSRFKGRLPWPVNGKIAVPYGSHRDPQFDTPVFRNGIHIQTDIDADAKSVCEGKVIFAEWFKGFGQLVIINHGGGYHSLYGNLSEIFSKVGDIIKDNQVIGKVGTSGILNAPGLYFEIRYKGKPLDPTQWLKRNNR
ncbi:MAG: peptidoglycan DD-metalloendopeptidase family protein [Nitrospirota bacterium]